ncbi:MAG: error-prone DNA polymerase [Thermomicrobiales bacterium]|nr:error-prone DNA polymerase [Thermomicrobiales bacterium]
MSYVELHLHTAFSFLDGASMPTEYAATAAAYGYTALAVTDHDGLYGAMEFAQALENVGIQPITGAEITMDDGSHITLLAETRRGYANLCRLITDAKHGRLPAPVALGPEPIDDSVLATCRLETYAEGLILLTGCREGQLSTAIAEGRIADAEYILATYISWFGADNVVVELQQNYVYGDTKRVAGLVELADRFGVRYAATGNVHYHVQERHRLQDVVVSIANRATLDTSHQQRRANAQFHLKTPEEMERIFCNYPEAIRTTELIAERCQAFNLTRDLDYKFPDYETMADETPLQHLEQVCREELKIRYVDAEEEDKEKARAQLQNELRLIDKHDLAGFFLMYRDLLDLAREVSIEIRGREARGSRRFLPPGRGRGSAVSSIICYLIGLSPVDPLAHDLYVGRFLNEELPSVPDIDIDFPREIREKMIERVYEVYGPDRVALVCAFSTYRLRSAVRDVGKALGLPAVDLDRIAKLSEPRGAAGLEQELDRFPEYANRKDTAPWCFLIDISRQLARFPRHITQHVGGMVISQTPINELIPIQPASMDGRYLCQWDKDSCDDARLIKIDFLALGMLSLVEEALDLIDLHGREPVDLSRIEFKDPEVYKMIQEGDTIGVFQIESRAQIQMIRRTKPEEMKDLVVQVAIVRPGPIIGGAVTPFVERRNNPNWVPVYDHPKLENLLKETLGVILYQEQVVQVAEVIAGFTAGQADRLRRAMTRKRSHDAMEELRQSFLEGALKQGDITIEKANEIFDKLAGFAEYGFPKSHAAAFAFLAYQSCWLKRYYPAEFLCALLNNQPMGFYAPHVLINDAKRHGLRVERPDVNASGIECTVEGRKTVRLGLALIKGIADDVAMRIFEERQLHGKYTSLMDLMRRVALRPGAQENLIAAGACDCFGLGRREMLWQIGLFIAPVGFQDKRTRKLGGQQMSLPLPTIQDHVELPPITPWEHMADEYQVLGLSVRHHPLFLLRHRLPPGMASLKDIKDLPDGSKVFLPGLVVARQRPGTAKGITFLLLEDEFNLVNIVVYPDLYARQRLQVRATPLLIVEGKLQLANNNVNIIAERLYPIEDSPFVAPTPNFAEDMRNEFEPEDVNPDRIQLVSIPSRNLIEVPITQADIRAVTPDSHNYH